MNHHLRVQNFDILIFQTNHSIKSFCIENYMRNQTGNCIYIIWTQIKIQYSPPYGSQCRFSYSFDFDFS